jgi:hypothetical protein
VRGDQQLWRGGPLRHPDNRALLEGRSQRAEPAQLSTASSTWPHHPLKDLERRRRLLHLPQPLSARLAQNNVSPVASVRLSALVKPLRVGVRLERSGMLEQCPAQKGRSAARLSVVAVIRPGRNACGLTRCLCHPMILTSLGSETSQRESSNRSDHGFPLTCISVSMRNGPRP